MGYKQQSPSGSEFIDWKVNQNCHVVEISDLPHEDIVTEGSKVYLGDKLVKEGNILQLHIDGPRCDYVFLRRATSFEMELTASILSNKTSR